MSEIDFKDPFLCQQLALSEKQSLNGPLQAKQFESGEDCFDACHKISNNNMFRSVNSGYRLSETTASKRSSPIKINTSLIRSSFNPSGRFNDLVQNNDSKVETPVFLENIGEEELFECQHELQDQDNCQICKGTGFVKGSNNLIKFFEYLIGFKLGTNTTYKEKKLTIRKKPEVNSFCNDFYNNNQVKNMNIRSTASNFTYRINTRASQKPSTNVRSSIYGQGRASQRSNLNHSERVSTKTTRICCKEDVAQQLSSLITIHENYKCDICECSPIVGARYHCHDCEDFDECEACYNKGLHPHIMQKIDKTGKGKQLQHVITILAQPSTNNIRESLRPPPTISMGNGSIKTTRSALR